MKRILFLFSVAVILVGCAGTQHTGEGERGQGYYDHIDHERMDRITRAARDRGNQIIWVNPPRKARSDENPEKR